MFLPAIDDVGLPYPPFEGLQTAPDFWNHTPLDRIIRDAPLSFRHGEGRNELPILVEHASLVGEQNEFPRLEGGSHASGHQVGVDVIRLAVFAGTDRCNDRYKLTIEETHDDLVVDRGYVSDHPHIDDLRRLIGAPFLHVRHFLGQDKAAVLP